MNPQDQISSQFVESITASIAHWRERSSDLDEQTLLELDNERHNLYRAIDYGLKLEQTRRDTAVVALQTFPLIERKGYWTDWIPILEKTVSYCSDQETELKCKLLNRLGQSYRLNRQLEKAIHTYLQSKEFAIRADNERVLAEVHCHLSEAYLLLRDYEQAEYYSLYALTSFEQMADVDLWIMSVLNTLGEIARNQGKTKTAEELFNRAINLARYHNHLLYLARFLSNRALNFQWDGQNDEALACYLEASLILATTDNEMDKTVVQNNIGILYYRQNQWQAAETAFHQANSDYLRRSPNLHLQAKVANNIGNVLIKQAKFLDANSHLQQAADLWQQVDDDLELANTFGSLAEALAGLEKTKEAVAYFDKALKLLEQFPDDAWAQQLQANFCQQRHQLTKDSLENGTKEK
jgi:tetratricopeptide (TPR) repeat protein